MIKSYPKVWTIGHPYIKDLFDGVVVVQEKVDGSQFSFGSIDGQFFARSRGAELHVDSGFPYVKDKLFQGAVETAYLLHRDGKLVDGWVYRGEVISKPKHNTLEYARTPKGFIILFDIDTGLEERIDDQNSFAAECKKLDLEFVPMFMHDYISSPEELKSLLDRESCLGGCTIEGVVVKNYNRWSDKDGKMLMGKYVSEAFKEKHKVDWKVREPGRSDIILRIIDALATDARFEKAVQRRRDAGLLEHAPQDIGPMIADIIKDTAIEEREWIKEQLFSSFEKEITRGVIKSFPQWYKDKLLKEAFADKEDA